MLRARFVKNFAANVYSVAACSSEIRRFDPSHSDSVKQLQDLVRSSILRNKEDCFPKPLEEKKPQSLKANLLPWGTQTPSKKGRLFYDLGEDGEPPFASEEKLKKKSHTEANYIINIIL